MTKAQRPDFRALDSSPSHAVRFNLAYFGSRQQRVLRLKVAQLSRVLGLNPVGRFQHTNHRRVADLDLDGRVMDLEAAIEILAQT